MRLKLLLALLIVSSTVFAQREIGEDQSIKDRGYLGFGFGGLSFGSDTYYGNSFSIGASALAGYMFTANLSAGVAIDYQYASYGDRNFKYHLYGGVPFVRYNISDFFIQADYGLYSLKIKGDQITEPRIHEERFFLGVGYSPQTGSRAQFNALLSYDVLYDNIGIFPSPLSLRVFVTFH